MIHWGDFTFWFTNFAIANRSAFKLANFNPAFLKNNNVSSKIFWSTATRIPVFSISQIEFIQGRHYKTLTDAVVGSDFLKIKRNMEKLKIAYQISEALDKLIRPPQKDPQIYQLLKKHLLVHVQ